MPSRLAARQLRDDETLERPLPRGAQQAAEGCSVERSAVGEDEEGSGLFEPNSDDGESVADDEEAGSSSDLEAPISESDHAQVRLRLRGCDAVGSAAAASNNAECAMDDAGHGECACGAGKMTAEEVDEYMMAVQPDEKGGFEVDEI